jgi:hypothetical protein
LRKRRGRKRFGAPIRVGGSPDASLKKQQREAAVRENKKEAAHQFEVAELKTGAANFLPSAWIWA